MNENTLISVHCYQGDAERVRQNWQQYIHHECPVVVLSPEDSPVWLPGVDCRHAGGVGYIGSVSLNRQVRHLEILLSYPQQFFLLNDSDSFCVSPEIPSALYQPEATIWSNECHEFRPHPSPYPKLAFQPPYFLSRGSIWRMLQVAGKVGCHEITPYIDWQMNALSFEAGIAHRPFSALEHPSTALPFAGDDCWKQLEYRIKNMGTVMCHPIKTQEQVALCVKAYAER